jgi:hypothetical protein
MEKTLILYIFHTYHYRVQHFFNKCIFYDENIDYVVICNDKNITFEVPSYVKKIQRDNIGFDFGGWSEALLTENLYKHYDNFIFVNSSVIGPFLKADFKGKWTDVYLNGLVDNVKLFGTTINTIDDPLTKSHVQSYIFSMKRETLEYLIECEIFSITNYAKNMGEAVWNKEVLMSRKVIENGWNIASLFSHYKDVDFTFTNKLPEQYPLLFLNDIMYSHCRNTLWNEYDLVFIKGNRVNIPF